MEQAVLDWFKTERGIEPDTLEAFGVRQEGDAIVFPYPEGEKHRTGIPSGERRFYSAKGLRPGLFADKAAVGTEVMFLCEGETDTMRLYQELGRSHTVLGLPGIEAWSSQMVDSFRRADKVYVVLDNDDDYTVKARVDKAWVKIRADLGPKAQRIRLPAGIKDICEFFDRHDLETFAMLVQNPPKLWHYEPLDLTQDPPPFEWLVDGLIGRGDVGIIIGEPYAGKSLLTMSLAVAMVENKSRWLGRALRLGSRVLYVDEENPEDVVYSRLKRMGLTESGAANLRYLHHQGVRLDRNPGDLLEEALSFEPDLILLDSLTRFHTGDENNAGDISKLFNDGINPLSRETGATTLVLHHVTKSDSSSSFMRSRGSGDITASADTGLDVRKLRNDLVNLVHYKSRRGMAGDIIPVRFTDTDEGGLVVDVPESPF